jgi:hypothetical protein
VLAGAAAGPAGAGGRDVDRRAGHLKRHRFTAR